MTTDNPTPPPHPATYVEWRQGTLFDAGRVGGPPVRLDGDAKAGPGPFDLLLCAIAACASTDVVSMLQAQHTLLSSLRVNISATRVTATPGSPRRLDSAVLNFVMRGTNLTQEQAERAVADALTLYCGVRASVHANAKVTWTVKVLP